MQDESLTQSDYISFPSSCIRAPGELLKDKKSFREVKTNQNLLRQLLDSGYEKSNSLSTPSTHSSGLTVDYYMVRSSSSETSSPLTSSFQFFSPRASPGTERLKVYDDSASIVIQKIKEIMFTYGIELVIELCPENYHETYELLKSLVSEICTFSRCFFKKIYLKQLIVCNKNSCQTAHFDKDITFIVEDLETEQKVHMRIFKIIFDHLVKANSKLVQAWKNIETWRSQDIESDENLLEGMEEAFMVLMKNGNQSLIRKRITKLKELMIKHYPLELSEDWFVSRRKDKKKVLKVSFNFENEEENEDADNC